MCVYTERLFTVTCVLEPFVRITILVRIEMLSFHPQRAVMKSSSKSKGLQNHWANERPGWYLVCYLVGC
jgi:hypothetical protein